MSNAPVAYVALGSNLGDSVLILSEAMHRLAALASAPVRRSSFWRSVPVDCPPGSPDFINAAVTFPTREGETPESLLSALLALEGDFGRQPKQVLNEARPLDLDLLAFGDEIRQSPALTLPHPRAHLRRFVLEPLNELAPDLILPGQVQTVNALLELLPAADCHRAQAPTIRGAEMPRRHS
jgi:2-amino-4-hydroxy-6-hydroxymethyldihydropteridine diphosphokinase